MALVHRIIRSDRFELNLVLAGLQQLAQDASRRPDFNSLYLELDCIEGFPETFHHPKEEAHLFEAVRQRKPDAGPLIDRLCQEHAAGTELMAELSEWLDAYARPSSSPPPSSSSSDDRHAYHDFETVSETSRGRICSGNTRNWPTSARRCGW